MDINHSSRTVILYATLDTERLKSIADHVIEHNTPTLIVTSKTSFKVTNQLLGIDGNTRPDAQLAQRMSALQKAPIFITDEFDSHEEMCAHINSRIQSIFEEYNVYIKDVWVDDDL